MIGKKINQLATELAPVSTDLTIIGDPTTGVSKKITLAQLGAIFSGAVSFYTNLAAFPVVGDINVIYCAKDTQKLYLWSGSAYTEVFPSQALLNTYQLRSEKGVSNGYASLDSGGKVPISQLPSSIMEYKGTWNAATNTPTLANGTGDTGDVYICNVAGTVNFGAGPLTFAVGDYVIYSGTIWQRSSGAVGTVTSVAATITGDAIGITGSPVTTSGTLALAFAGNSTQYVNGAGNLVTFPGIVNQAQNLITEVYNKTGATLTKGTVVYINGGQGNLPSVTKALATGDATSAQTYGIVQNNITNNNNGYVVVAGRISDLDTQAFTEGTQLYLSPTTAGTYTSTKPYAPQHLVYVGIVVRAHPTQGVVEVKIQNGYEMDELHNVAAQSPDNNDILQYKTTTSLWTKVAGTTSNIAEGTNLYYTEARVNANTNVAANTAARHNAVTIGTANGLSLSTQVLSLALASGSTTGALTSTDWNTFNGKQNALSGTGFVKISGTTISYDNSTYVTTDTFQTISASKTFGVGFSLASAGGTNQLTSFVNTNSIHSGSAGTNIFGFNSGNNIYFGKGLSNGGVITFNNAAVRFYALPDADGTIALVGGSGVGTVTSVGLSSATSGVTIGSSPITSSGTITLAIATASGSQQGLLSSTDWTTFNNKQSALTNPVTGTGTTNYLPKFTGTSTIGNSQIFDNGTNVGIGNASPAYKLDVQNGSDFDIRLRDTSLGGTVGILFETANDFSGTSQAYIKGIGAGNSGRSQLIFGTATNVGDTTASTKMTLDASGNLGLGVTPSAWDTVSAMQFTGGSVASYSNYAMWLTSNAFYTAASGWKYVASNTAAQYLLDGNVHKWYTAPSGTAGNAISFTQAMTLDASGRLGIGTTSPTEKLHVAGNIKVTIGDIDVDSSTSYIRANNTRIAGTDRKIQVWNNVSAYIDVLTMAATGAATFSSSVSTGTLSLSGSTFQSSGDFYIGTNNANLIQFYTSNANRMIITPTGNVGIGQPNPQTTLEINGGNSYFPARIVTLSGAEATRYNGFIGLNLIGGSQLAMSLGTRSNNTDYANTLNLYNGNVGIGTTSPNARLDLGGSYGANGEKFLIYNDNSSSALAGTKVGFYMDRFGLANNSTFVFATAAGAPGSFIVSSKDTSGTTLVARMAVLGESGNVGIGTTSPTATLHVNGTIKTASPSSGSAHAWKLGSYAAGGTGTATGVIYIEVNGQIYSIPALLGTP